MSFCQFGGHDPTIPHIQTLNEVQAPENGTSSTWTVCGHCLDYLKTVKPGSDLTMKILYCWALQCGDAPKLPNSLKKDCLKMAELVYQIDRKLNNEIRPKMKDKQYPRFLKDHEEKDVFIQWLKNDEGIKAILHDVSSGDERKNLSLRLWAGLKDAAKTLRKTNLSTPIYSILTKK
jgi:hypothetical protein